MFALFDRLNDDVRNLFVKTDADIRCIVREAESGSFQTVLRQISLEHLEDAFPGGRRLASGVRCPDKCLVAESRIFQAVTLRMANCLSLIDGPGKGPGFWSL